MKPFRKPLHALTMRIFPITLLAVLCFAGCSSDSGDSGMSSNGGSASNANPPLLQSTTALAAATVGQSYSATITATGGAAPLSFSVLSGSALPAGLNLASDGMITGIPSLGTEGDYSVAIQVSDSSANILTATRIFTLTVGANVLSIGPSSLPPAINGENYSAQLTAQNGTAPYMFRVTSGGTFNGTTGVSNFGNNTGLSMTESGLISTTGIQTLPADAFIHAFSVRVTDSSTPAKSTTTSYSIKFDNTPTLADLTLPRGHAQAAYSHQFEIATGENAGPFTWSAVGSLPSGLQLASTGELQGTPTSAGIYNVSVRATSGSVPPQTLNGSTQLIVYANQSYTYSADMHEQNGGNDSAATATDRGALTPLSGTINQSTPLSIDDTTDLEDWYRFTLPYQTAVEAELFFDNAIADVDLELYDITDTANPRLVDYSITYSNDERIYAHNLSAGAYAIRMSVNSFGPGANQYTYRIRLLPLTIVTDYIEIDLNGGFNINTQLQARSAGNALSNPMWSMVSGDMLAGISLTSDGFLTGTPLEFGYRNLTLQVSDGNLVATKTLAVRIYDSTRGSYWRARPDQLQYAPGTPEHNTPVTSFYAATMVTAPHMLYPDGALYVLGGVSDITLDNTWVYHTDAMNAGAADRANRLWKMEASVPMTSVDPANAPARLTAPRRYFGAAFLQHSYGGYIYAIGGETVTNPGQHITTGIFNLNVDRLRVADGNGNPVPPTAWETVASLPNMEPLTGNDVRGWAEFATCAHDDASDNMDRIFLIGGTYEVESDPTNDPGTFTKNPNRWVLMFEAGTSQSAAGSWYIKSDADQYTAGRFPSATLIDGRIYMTSGRGANGMFNGIEMYQPSMFGDAAATNTANASNFPRLREGVYLGCAADDNGQMYFCGGWNSSFAATPWLYRFTPSASGVGGQLEALPNLDGGQGFGPGAWHDERFWALPGLGHGAPTGFGGIFDYTP